MENKGIKYKFIVIAKGEFTPARFGEFLNTFYSTEGEEAHFKIGNVPKDGFYVPHGVITRIKKEFPDWKIRFEFFIESPTRKVHSYSIPEKNKNIKIKEVKKCLAEIRLQRGDKNE